MITYTEDETLVLARMVDPLISWEHEEHVSYAYDVALYLRGSITEVTVPDSVMFFVRQVQFNSVPTYLKYPDLETLIQWRLRIGK